jgi:hypothetical protein
MATPTGEALRDQGIQLTLLNNDQWMEDALREIPRFKVAYPEFIGEELRSWLTSNHIYPSSPNAWGALTRTLLTQGRIRDTGRVRKMKAPKSHARRSPIWTWA